MREASLGAMPLVLNAAEGKSMFEFIQDPQFTMGQLCDPDTQGLFLREEPAWRNGQKSYPDLSW